MYREYFVSILETGNNGDVTPLSILRRLQYILIFKELLSSSARSGRFDVEWSMYTYTKIRCPLRRLKFRTFRNAALTSLVTRSLPLTYRYELEIWKMQNFQIDFLAEVRILHSVRLKHYCIWRALAIYKIWAKLMTLNLVHSRCKCCYYHSFHILYFYVS